MNTRFVAALLLLSLPLGISYSQTGALSGRLTESGSTNPIAGVTVRLIDLHDSAGVRGAFTDVSGDFRIEHLSPSAYRVVFSSIGYKPRTVDSVVVTGSAAATCDAALDPDFVSLDAVVVSASRISEKLIDAPASITVIDARDIQTEPSLSPTDHLRSTTGVDIAQTGLVQQNIVTRGFNNVFSGSMTMLTDNRIAAVPSLRVNVPSFIPLVDDDIERIEVVRGPGSALYGPNAAQGVMNIVTRSPFSSQGTSLSVTGGERSLFQGTVRHAGVIGENFGYKISGQYLRGEDWPYVDSVEAEARRQALLAGASPDTLKIGDRDPILERFGGEARIDWLASRDVNADLTVGFNQAVRTIELSDIGAAQGRNWRYTYIQGRVNFKDLFVQAFLNQNDAGQTYLLRSGGPIVDRSKQIVAQIQHSAGIGDRQRFTYGLDMQLTRPVTDQTITGRNEENDNIDEFGGYVQSETQLVEKTVDLVVAGRIDKHSEIADAIFSPRAAIVYRPWENQNFRLTFNRAYSTPLTTEFFLDLLSVSNVFGFPPGYEVDVRASGVPSTGFTFATVNGIPEMHSVFAPDRSMAIPVDNAVALWPAIVQILAAKGVDISGIPAPGPSDIHAVMATLNPETQAFDPVPGPQDVAPLKPTITQTVEFGYKGGFADAIQAGIDLYYSRVTNFVGQLHVITPSVFLNGEDVKTYLESNGMTAAEAAQLAAVIDSIPIGTVTPTQAVDPTALLMSTSNFGTVNLVGMDLSLQVAFSDQFSAAATYSFVDKNYFEKLDGLYDLALNAPKHRASLTLTYRRPEAGLTTELRTRWSDGFRMNSGVYAGIINPVSLFDAIVGYDLPSFPGVSLTVSALNVLDAKHRDFIGAPEIGRLVTGRLSFTF